VDYLFESGWDQLSFGETIWPRHSPATLQLGSR